jgi:aspartate aminotransferase-like enzyme/GNAT superfamily N-acetyltransferase
VQFRIASEPSEFEQIFRLAYETFVEEIPQHPPNADRRHVDRFHSENTYLIALDDGAVVGMLAVRGVRPFSLDEKLGSVDPYLPAGRRVCELRLLAVRPSHRRGLVFRGLVDLLMAYGRAQGYDLAIISGTLRQTKLYRHLGFEPFGPLVGTPEAPFQPMFITIEQFERTVPALSGLSQDPVAFLPGPVPLAAEVKAAFERTPISHRSAAFRELFDRARTALLRLAGARRVQLLVGSGTLANDVVAAQLSLVEAPGVVVSNGEFGDRLIDHARRHRLAYDAVRFAWGERIDSARVDQAVTRTGARWLWAVLSETSTGMLNDLEGFKALASRRGLSLCLDVMSAIGAVPLDLRGVRFASGASGKALAALPGLAMVFYQDDVEPAPDRLPRYLDLGYYAATGGVPFTHSSNLLAALEAALARFDSSRPFDELRRLSTWLRGRLRELGVPVLVPDDQATPAVVTIPLPADQSSTVAGECLRRQGLVVAYESEYLVRRNWLQIGLMGACTQTDLERLLGAMRALDLLEPAEPPRAGRGRRASAKTGSARVRPSAGTRRARRRPPGPQPG